jgi:hypothetical protein
MKYQAVNRDQLVEILGKTCSPMPSRNGYVIGPDLNGRLCHCSTHFTMAEAKHHADKLNQDIKE